MSIYLNLDKIPDNRNHLHILIQKNQNKLTIGFTIKTPSLILVHV